jgi:hypothetical protein
MEIESRTFGDVGLALPPLRLAMHGLFVAVVVPFIAISQWQNFSLGSCSSRSLGSWLFGVLNHPLLGVVAPLFFSRLVIPACDSETRTRSAMYASILAAVAFLVPSFGSDALPFFGVYCVQAGSYIHSAYLQSMDSPATDAFTSRSEFGFALLYACIGGLIISHCVASGLFIRSASFALNYFLPFDELNTLYGVLSSFIPVPALHMELERLFIATANVQIGVGYVGIWYSRAIQKRRNALLKVGGGEDAMGARMPAKAFHSVVALYILAVALPYFLQRTTFETLNAHTFQKMRGFTESELRLQLPFEESGALLSVVGVSNHTGTRENGGGQCW